MTTLTVFTPTYNRAHTLPRVFESLKRQTSHDFLWLIVDDGSTDDTRELVMRWRDEAPFRIEYLHQENRGKHNAHNAAIEQTQTVLFLIIDSDDELLPHAVQTIVSEWEHMSPDEKRRIAGIWTLCCDADGQIIGGELPVDVRDASLQELRYKHKDNREMMPAFVTAVLRRYSFPETPPGDCSFIPEDYVWTRITRDYPIRFLNVACRIYHPGEGLMSMARDQYRFSRSAAYGYFAPLTNELAWFWYEPLTFLLTAIQAARYGMYSRDFGTLARPLTWKGRVLLFAAVPIAVLLLVRDKLTGRIARQRGARP